MHCGDAPCINACPRQALSKKKDSGAVIADQKLCMGCTFCLWVCPYGVPQIGIKGKIEKCNFCETRPLGMKRACEEICPTQAIVSGPKNEIGRAAKKNVADNLLGSGINEIVLGF
jgi:Fe-S-cluster-containing dehydrogenase component